MDDRDEPTGRDLRMVWKTIAVVGALAVGAWVFGGPVLEWSRDVTVQLKLLQVKADETQKRIERLERWRERMSGPQK